MASKIPDSCYVTVSSDHMSRLELADTSCGKISRNIETNCDSGIILEEGNLEFCEPSKEMRESSPCEMRRSPKCKEMKREIMESGARDSGVVADVSSNSSSLWDSGRRWKGSFNKPESKYDPRSSPSNLISERDEFGNTIFHDAIIRKDEKAVRILLQNNLNAVFLDEQNDFYQTCLHLSVLVNLPRVTRLLFLAGAKTDIEDMNGNTALHLACKMNNLECVIELLKPLTDDDFYEQTRCPLLYTPVLDYSRKYLDAYNYDGLSCLHIAAASDNRKIMDQLFKHQADVNIRECKGGYTILHEAVETGYENLVHYILQNQYVDINKRTYARKTAYQLSSGSRGIQRLLIEKRRDQCTADDSFTDKKGVDVDSGEYDSDYT